LTKQDLKHQSIKASKHQSIKASKHRNTETPQHNPENAIVLGDSTRTGESFRVFVASDRMDDSKEFDGDDDDTVVSQELSPQWILDQRQKSLERERKLNQVSSTVDMAVAIAFTNSPSQDKDPVSKKLAAEDQKPTPNKKVPGANSAVSSYWESEFLDRSTPFLESSETSSQPKIQEMDDAKAKDWPTATPDQPDRCGSGVEKNILHKRTGSQASRTEASDRPEMTAISETTSDGHTSIPGAYAQAGPGIEEVGRRDSAVAEVMAALQQQSEDPSDALESGSILAMNASTMGSTCRDSRVLTAVSSSSDPPSSLVNAEMVNDAEAIFYAEDIKKDYRRRLTYLVIFAAFVCVVFFSLVFGPNKDETPVAEDVCDFEDDRCCVPVEEMPLPESVPLICYCTNTTEGIYDNFTESNESVYTLTMLTMIYIGAISFEERSSIDTNSCDPVNQMSLTAALFDRWGVSVENTTNAPEAAFKNLFVLAFIYITLDGVNWTQDDEWFEDAEVCNYFGVGCVFVYTLSELNLPYNGLKGPLPSVIGLMPSLRGLDLSGNINVTGTIPTELGNLETLTILDLSEMSLAGTIPSSLGNLDRLDRLTMIGSQLTGALPTELFQLTNIRSISLSRNNFNGTIPAEVGQSTNLNILGLNENELTGTLPTELAKLSRLELLSIRANKFEGTIPDFLGLMPRLSMINLYQSGLTGAIPDTFCNDERGRAIIVSCPEVQPCACCDIQRNAKVRIICGESLYPQELAGIEL
jgi:hypothetical protein